MIILPMLGRSSRFFNAGYSKPKFQLMLGDRSVFDRVTSSFVNYFENTPFLFLVRQDFDTVNFVSSEVVKLGIKDFRIIEFQHETCGQAESVYEGTLDYSGDISVTIFNIDTIRHDFIMPLKEEMCDGLLEVFNADGNSWSFIKPGIGNDVLLTTEKNRISDYCSNGLYVFSKLSDFRDAYKDHIDDQKKKVNGELYIAPLYNHLINKGKKIKYRLVEAEKIEHCGVPSDYESLKKKLAGR